MHKTILDKLIFIPMAIALLLIQQPIYAYESTYTAAEMSKIMPENARVWEDRNGVEGSGYSHTSGGSVIFFNNLWYAQIDNLSAPPYGENWHLIHEGPVLNLDSVGFNIETLEHELFSGSAFQYEGLPHFFGMNLDGQSGELIREDGSSFNPHNYIKLQDSDGVVRTQYFYDTVSKVWWDAHPDRWGTAVSPPIAPYKPIAIPSGGIPDSSLFSEDSVNQYTFDVEKLRYLHNEGPSIAGFHRSSKNSYRRWDHANYQDNEGENIAFHNNVWYVIEDETHYIPFHEGRYLNFNYGDYDRTIISGLEIFLYDSLSLDNLPSDINAKLDGVTGRLVSEYTSNPPLVILLSQQLSLQGVTEVVETKPVATFKSGSTKVTLLRVVPLRNNANDPFNDRSLPITIAKARRHSFTPTIVTPGGGGPPPGGAVPPPLVLPPIGGCPLNTPLIFIGALPDAKPSAQSINLNPLIDQLGLNATPIDAALNINIVNAGDSQQAVVSLAAGFTFISGSPFGTVTEGSDLLYYLNRTADDLEFEFRVTFSVDLVGGSMGIVIQTLSARMCNAAA